MSDKNSSTIAIVGLSGVFPKAEGSEHFWRNIVNKMDATDRVFHDRWIAPTDWVYAESFEKDKAYARQACLIDDFKFNPTGYLIDKSLLIKMDPLFQWVLHASNDALTQTDVSAIDHRRMGVILAAIALPTQVSSSISRHIMGHQLSASFSKAMSEIYIDEADMLSGRVVSMPSAIVSQALGLGGISFTLDAACASSLYSVKLACDMLQNHKADAMIAGGVSRPDCLYTQIGFSQLRALSRSGRCAPFDATADGLVVGEGAGIMVLKRLDDALAQKDTILGIIRGIGISNDMRGNLLAPESDGQLRAMRSAYQQSGWNPHDVDYIECHGAGTPVGDATELQSLRTLWGEDGWQKGQCAIGSIKSMIGHLLTAAGAAGMIKTVLALSNKTLPPSLKFQSPKPDSPLIGSPFRVQTDAEPWNQRDNTTPRRAAISAFGFGGINAHVLIEEWLDQDTDKKSSPAIKIQEQTLKSADKETIAIVGMDLCLGSLTSLKSFHHAVFNGTSAIGPVPPERWKAPGYAYQKFGPQPCGNFIHDISVELGEFQIPPGEIPDILPQQLLMLKVAAGAMNNANLPLRQARERMGTIIGISFDYEATNFHLRWALPKLMDQWSPNLNMPADQIPYRWLIDTKDDCSQALDATRTLGALGGIVASRIAREFRFGGPSFVISAEEASGMAALHMAQNMLVSNEVDAMLVGAVDLNGDERNMATLYDRLGLSAKGEIRPFDDRADGTLPGEGAVALVLKRLGDAKADKDRIYCTIKGSGYATGQKDGSLTSNELVYIASLEKALKNAAVNPGQIDLMECHASGIPDQDQLETKALHHCFVNDNNESFDNAIAISTLKPIIGHTGAVSGLASLAKAALCLYHQIVPPVIGFEKPSLPQWRQGIFHLPAQPAFWSRNRSEGPRTACVASITSDGQCMHTVLEQTEDDQIKDTGTDTRHRHPLGPLPYGLFIINGENSNQIIDRLSALDQLANQWQKRSIQPIEAVAHQWHLQSPGIDPNRNTQTAAIVCHTLDELKTYIESARSSMENGTTSQMGGRGGLSFFAQHPDVRGKVAFVYPGSGNHYIGMGRTLGAHWPQVLREMESMTDHFKSQLLPRWYDPYRFDWPPAWQQETYDQLVADPLNTIFGQVLFGGQMTRLIKQFNISADAVIGYSLGESAGLFAMGAWPDRGMMLERLEASDLFKTQLTGPCESVRNAWNLPSDQPITWKVAAVNRDQVTVDQTIADLPYVRRLIVNTPSQCVIGGLKDQVATAIERMKCTAVYLDGVVTVHCDAAQPSAHAYNQLHRFETTPVNNVDFYSCAFEKTLDLTTESAADSITKQATDGFHFPRTIEQAYEDGIRIFLEIGPHCSCTRMIDQILEGKPYQAVAANHRNEDEPLSLLKCLGTLAAAGIPIDLDPLYGYSEHHLMPQSQKTATSIQVPVGGKPLSLTMPPTKPVAPKPQTEEMKKRQVPPQHKNESDHRINTQNHQESIKPVPGPADPFKAIIDQLNQNTAATAKAHEQFLELTQELTTQYGQALEWQAQLLNNLDVDSSHLESLDIDNNATASTHPVKPSTPIPVAFDRSQCMEFAIGSVGKMLGSEFGIIDTYKARVRLPDTPLMLVDRIMSVEGEKLGLGSGRVVTEHDVLPGAWYLDGDRAPVCISVEAGQADLFLCAYLGIDHQVKGERTYRLLDAKIRFHRGLPRPNETIRYDIRIDKFVRQEETYLFFFRFEGFIGDEHLITMTNGCAGFFTEEEVRNSGGIILTEDDKASDANIQGTSFTPIVPVNKESYDDAQIDALRAGNIGDCFGSEFSNIQLPQALCLPGERMRLIHRVISLEPTGGRFGKGIIKAEADIHPHDWFLTCHFVDDMVMPGTLMYECCAHTLRVLLLRLGWVSDKTDVCYEPIQGLDCSLKCRGPVTPSTQNVHYVVEIKEIGYHPEPYVIADAHMYADGHYIVFFKDMSMQMTGVNEQDIQDFWRRHNMDLSQSNNVPIQPHDKPLYTHEDILEFSVGSPSKAFGQPYEVFDRERVIARLPGPPYCFMDRITSIEPPQWVLQADGWVEAQYDIPEDAWYFQCDRSGIMPFCVLLEIALQPCGWLAAYAGSALQSENDLKFRNLGGKSVLLNNIKPLNQTLTMRTRMTKVSDAADMIIENFDFEVLCDQQMIYKGTTYFGFFTSQALSQQKGLRESVYTPTERELQNTMEKSVGHASPQHPDDAQPKTVYLSDGLHMPSKALCMVDHIDIYCPDGGPKGLGFIRGQKIVDPDEWFFKAHFYQDPVCPGSLGIESFLQLIKHAAMERWPHLKRTHRFEMACDREQQWSYRGQVIPANRTVTVEAVITHIEDNDPPAIFADGTLRVDGIYIYKMEGFGLRLVSL